MTFGAPLYRDRVEADQHVTRMGRMEAVLAGDGPLPRAVCAWMCRHRTAASRIAAGYRSDLPIPVARSGVKHTWNTYTGSMNGLIRDTGWQTALAVLGRAGTPVTLAAGDADPVPVSGRAAELARAWPNVEDLGTRTPTTGCPSPIQTGVAGWWQPPWPEPSRHPRRRHLRPQRNTRQPLDDPPARLGAEQTPLLAPDGPG